MILVNSDDIAKIYDGNNIMQFLISINGTCQLKKNC